MIFKIYWLKNKKNIYYYLGDFIIKKIIDACASSADIAYRLSQVIPIYPITPSSPMAEYCSTLNSKGVKNIFGEDVKMVEMQYHIHPLNPQH